MSLLYIIDLYGIHDFKEMNVLDRWVPARKGIHGFFLAFAQRLLELKSIFGVGSTRI